MPSKAFGKHLRACSNSYQLCEGGAGGRGGRPSPAGGWDGLRSVWVGTSKEQMQGARWAGTGRVFSSRAVSSGKL